MLPAPEPERLHVPPDGGVAMAGETVSGNVSQGEPSKACSKCGVVRPLGEFRRSAGAPDGRRSDCKPCSRAVDMAYRASHPEAIRERKSSYRQKNVGALREAGREYQRRYLLLHPDSNRRWREANPQYHREWCGANPQYHREYHREWRARNPQRCVQHCHLRRARLKGTTGNQPVARAEIWTRDGGRCHVCGKACNVKSWHLDHLIPISLGGPHAPWNVAVAHPRCNLSRGNRGPAQPRLL